MDISPFDDWLADWHHKAAAYTDTDIALTDGAQQLMAFIHHHSPYLRDLLLRHPDIMLAFSAQGADHTWDMIRLMLDANHQDFANEAALSKHMRLTKQRAALLIALADIADSWDLAHVTMALSQLADHTVKLALDYLLQQAAKKGDISLNDMTSPSTGSGLIILGMGKLGGFELNYSSDIDVIVFYEAGCLSYQGRHSEQHFLNKLTQQLIQLMHERNADGYVFRMDIRLRPDPSSMPLAISTDAALNYYEGLGQNWERAAMIKARQIAGDTEAGARLMQRLSAYVWRRSLDFASVQDILSIKRQISKKIGIRETLYGHNIKLGKGGIREIEFFTQIHQLIWGGRQLTLRSRETLTTLQELVRLEHISKEDCQSLSAAYQFYRKLEHRLQMVEDQQTHSLPNDEATMLRAAQFMGYEDEETFLSTVQHHISGVHRLFIESFEAEGLSAAEGNLVFTGSTHDPETLQTLRNMGFRLPETVSQSIMDWHRGNRRCTRSKVARQLLTELVPDILTALSNTIHPMEAFNRFDRFLRDLPVGIQLFSLIQNNPEVLHIIADVMGSAPTLSRMLAQRPQLVETTLFPNFHDALANKATLSEELNATLEHVEHFDAAMEHLRQYKNEKHFKAGLQMLRHAVSGQDAGHFLSDLADTLIHQAMRLTRQEFEAQYGTIPQGRLAIIALGKLGSRELTFGSDVDIMFIYDAASSSATSSGKLSYAPSVYYNRLCQRIVSALSTIGTHGALYEVDTRLRPSGEQGLLAVSLESFTKYFHEDAWTFEHMALCKARPIAGDASLSGDLTAELEQILRSKRDRYALAADVMDMRQRVAVEFPSKSIWNIKHTAGGLMDSDFAAQYMLLASGHDHPDMLAQKTSDILTRALNNPAALERLNIRASDVQSLLEANQFLCQLQHILRLTSEKEATLESPPPGLADMLITHMDCRNFDNLKEKLIAIEKSCNEAYLRMV